MSSAPGLLSFGNLPLALDTVCRALGIANLYRNAGATSLLWISPSGVADMLPQSKITSMVSNATPKAHNYLNSHSRSQLELACMSSTKYYCVQLRTQSPQVRVVSLGGARPAHLPRRPHLLLVNCILPTPPPLVESSKWVCSAFHERLFMAAKTSCWFTEELR